VTPPGQTHCFSVRRLNPFTGVIQVVEWPDARALSSDAMHWEIQIRAERPDDLWGAPRPGPLVTQFLKFGNWSRDRGLRHIPANPLIDFGRLKRQAEAIVEVLDSHVDATPFPLADRYEFWLLDDAGRLPLALIASATSPERLIQPLHLRWVCADHSVDDFPARETDRIRTPHPQDSNPHPHMSALERMIRIESGHTLGQWFRRGDDGSGESLPMEGFNQLNGRNLTAAAFPELMLREEWNDGYDSSLVAEYLEWQAPTLLTLDRIRDKTRSRLEQQAKKRALEVVRHCRLYPRIIHHEIITAARVEARLRRN
jgi:hypothetical protein